MLIYIDEPDSTNDYAKANIEELPDRAVIYTNRQKAGKGQFGRVWVSDFPENVYMSLVLKPKKIQNLDKLTIFSGEIVKETLEQYGVKPVIKPPNDVLIGEKKICGILTESIFCGETLKGIVVGFGININMSEFDLKSIDIPATSLNLEIGCNVNRIEFINCLLDNFFKRYDELFISGR